MSLISLVIPVYNEEESLVELYKQIREALEPSTHEFEILFIDDGSQDKSLQIMHELSSQDPRVKTIGFQRNHGKATALNTGFQKCEGDYVITMDADLQDDPNEVLELIAILDSGWDMVSGWKKVRHDPIGKRWPSKLYNFTVSTLSGIPIHDFNCGLKAYTRKVVKNIELYGEMHRYIPVLAKQKGFTCTEKVVSHRARKYGESKYGIKRLFTGYLDLFTVMFLGTYMRKPMHFFGLAGMLLLVLGMAILAFLSFQWFRQYLFGTGQWIGGRPIFYIGMLLSIIGGQFISMGLLGELITSSLHKENPVIRGDD
ncbi:MAG: glycosyltransferase family 2 protein [Candidatus Marinimicrobia bacterium]|nr:glycosyltransferase family 2 protein [FCB group bacterium]MBL7024330.1 glycosyltransferase family 2 protein [Candidatus Neomarinimicrobiota bacterium]